MDLLTLEHFAGALNDTFSAALQDMAVDFVLVEATPLPGHRADAARAPFSLLFLNAAPIVFPQQTFQMRHPRLGEVGIFMVPIAQNRDGFVYQAIFN